MKRLTATRGRKIATITVSVLLAVVASAAAYWLVTSVIGEGESSTKIGHAEKTTEHVPLQVRLAEPTPGIVPGVPFAFEVFVDKSKLKNPMEIHRAIVTFTNSNEPACSDSWFRLAHLHGNEPELFGAGLKTNLIYKPEEGSGFLTELGAEIELENNPEVNQEACEGASLHVHVTTEP
jgi:hypothetical protein